MGDYTTICKVPNVRSYGGVEYAFEQLSIDDMAQATAHVRKTRAASLTASLDGVLMDSDTRALAYAKLASETITSGTLMDDAEGRIKLIALSLERAGKPQDIKQLRLEFPALPFSEILDLMLWITGERAEMAAPADPTAVKGTATSVLSSTASAET